MLYKLCLVVFHIFVSIGYVFLFLYYLIISKHDEIDHFYKYYQTDTCVVLLILFQNLYLPYC